MLQVHHLEFSRSSRILWLVEELGVEYELVRHKRGPDMRAGPDLAAVHPLGKAPAIVDDGLALVESSAILRYIAARYGAGRLVPSSLREQAKHDEWLDYAEGSLMPPLLMKLLGAIDGGLSGILAGFAEGGTAKALDYVSDGVSAGPYLMGDQLTIADIQMSFCLAMAEGAGLVEARPPLLAYWRRLQAEPGFQRSIEVGGPLLHPGLG